MATFFFLHATANTAAGTWPTLPQGNGGSATVNATGATTLRVMNSTIGTSQTSHAFTTSATTSQQTIFFGAWVSPPLGAQTLSTSGGGWQWANALLESNLNANVNPSFYHVYVWRPSTGALVATLKDISVAAGSGAEPTTASSEQSSYSGITGITISNTAIQDGDVLIVEAWAKPAQAMATAYTGNFYYDGTTATAATGTVVSSQASYCYFPVSPTLSTSVTVAVSGNSATSAVGTVGLTKDGAVALTGVSATGSVGTVFAGGGPLTVALTGVAAAGGLGTLGPQNTRALSGTQGTAAAGAVALSRSLGITGNAATGAVGTVGITKDGLVALTGVAGTSSVGSVAPSASKGLSGNVGTGAAGSVGPSLSLAFTGNAATGSAGTFGLTKSGAVALTGVSATGAVGSVFASVPVTVAISGVGATGSVGNVGTLRSSGLTGNAGASAAGSLAVTRTIAITAAGATTAVGSFGFTKSGSAALTGVAAVGRVGYVHGPISIEVRNASYFFFTQ